MSRDCPLNLKEIDSCLNFASILARALERNVSPIHSFSWYILTAARSSWHSAPRNEFFYIIALRHTAHFRGKLGRACRERDLPQLVPELIVNRVRAESFFLSFENYDRDLYLPQTSSREFTSDNARNEQHRIQEYFSQQKKFLP